jgi:hypothetical protein
VVLDFYRQGKSKPVLGKSKPVLGKSKPVLGKSKPVLGKSKPVLGKSRYSVQKYKIGQCHFYLSFITRTFLHEYFKITLVMDSLDYFEISRTSLLLLLFPLVSLL